jgi:hypothetical protein
MLNQTEKRCLLGIVGVLLTLTIPYGIGVLDPNIENAQSLCPFKMATGMPCPGCGITKSLIFLYQGELTKSISYHLFGLPLVLFCVISLGILIAKLTTNKLYFKHWIYSKQLAYGLGTVLILYHSIRLLHFIQHTTLTEIALQSIWK